MIPRGAPDTPSAPMRVTDGSLCGNNGACSQYRTAWPQEIVDSSTMVDTERNHPQFAFRAGGPATMYQIDVESQLRRLDQPMGPCSQGIIPFDAPLYYNTVEPPTPVGVPENVQNAANPMAAMIRDVGADQCRRDADAVAMELSGKTFYNHTRQDTKRFVRPFAPPGIGSA